MSRIERRERSRGAAQWHEYFLDGIKVTGVTTALGILSKGDGLTWWSAREAGKFAVANREWLSLLPEDEQVDLAARAHDTARREAAARGTALHDLVVPLLRGEQVDPPEDDRLAALARAAVRFMDEWSFRPIITESLVWSSDPRYAGTLDLVGTSPLFPGRVFLADWKTNRKAIYPEVGLQLAAYANAEFYVDEDGEDVPMETLGITDHIALHLTEDGYAVQATSTEPETFDYFKQVLRTHELNKRLHKGLLLGELASA